MGRTESDKLYVNLSASQTRKRLKGHGFGVKQVEAAGRNQAVITHTATGQHLRELRSLFADSLPSQSQAELGTPVTNLRNLGPTSAYWLKEVGIRTREDLERHGAPLAYHLVRDKFPQASLNLLWALAGALEDLDWRDLPEETRSALRDQLP